MCISFLSIDRWLEPHRAPPLFTLKSSNEYIRDEGDPTGNVAAFIVLIVYFPTFCFLETVCECLECVYVYYSFFLSPIFGYCSVATFQIHTQLGLIQFQYERPREKKKKKTQPNVVLLFLLLGDIDLPLLQFFFLGRWDWLQTNKHKKKKQKFFSLIFRLGFLSDCDRSIYFFLFIPLCRFVSVFSPFSTSFPSRFNMAVRVCVNVWTSVLGMDIQKRLFKKIRLKRKSWVLYALVFHSIHCVYYIEKIVLPDVHFFSLPKMQILSCTQHTHTRKNCLLLLFFSLFSYVDFFLPFLRE